jgi:large conductance mechanosensitive channel
VKQLLDDFKKFLLSGDVVMIAVGLIIALAFKAVVDSLITNIVNPLIGAIVGKPSFGDLTLKIGKGVFTYGNFINDVINFVAIGFVLFMIVKVYDKAKSRKAAEEPEPPTSEELLTEIRDLLKAQRSA